MPGIKTTFVSVCICVWLLAAAAAHAEPVRAALVIGNEAYTALPAVAACGRSANLVAAALRTLGFEMTERHDSSTGGIVAGIFEFSQHLAAGKGTGFVFVCGYAADFNDRTFLLPASANIARPSDVLTQGILAKALLNTISGDPDAVGMVVFDLIAKPDSPKINLDALANLVVPDGVGVLAVSQAAPTDRPTPLAEALAAALAGPVVRTNVLFTAVKTRLGAGAVTAMAAHAPVRPGVLAGKAPPDAYVPPQPPVAIARPFAPRPAIMGIPEVLPDETLMTDEDRRKIQKALTRLGFYSLPADGHFGPETRAAIRRYQHQIGAEMNGILSAAQASRLVSTR